MDYQQTLDFLFSQLPVFQRDGASAYKANLENALKLDDYFDHPHLKFKTIHIAGTNGKGSVSHMLASVLQATGYQTGLYTSPHLKDFRERIKINGEMISEPEVVDFVEIHQDIIVDLKPSFFEITVAMAFDYFARMNVDIAVIEVGMGGRLDSTNIIRPIVSVITNIGFDHIQFLGKTLELIALEKAGIIKEGTPAIIGETQVETEHVFRQFAQKKNSVIIFSDQVRTIKNDWYSDDKYNFRILKGIVEEYPQLTIDLQGGYQKRNVLTVLATLDLIKKHLHITAEHIQKGLLSTCRTTGLKGRWQILSENPMIVCDTGHNEHGLRQVIEQISKIPFEKLHVVLGMVNDKDHGKILTLMPVNASYYFTRAQIPRALDEKELMTIAANFGLKGNAYPSVAEAIESAKSKASPNDMIFIGGSTFIVAEVPGL
jgi:dihydrofolate synthase / folylpolyglutamate synthase